MGREKAWGIRHEGLNVACTPPRCSRNHAMSRGGMKSRPEEVQAPNSTREMGRQRGAGATGCASGGNEKGDVNVHETHTAVPPSPFDTHPSPALPCAGVEPSPSSSSMVAELRTACMRQVGAACMRQVCAACTTHDARSGNVGERGGNAGVWPHVDLWRGGVWRGGQSTLFRENGRRDRIRDRPRVWRLLHPPVARRDHDEVQTCGLVTRTLAACLENPGKSVRGVMRDGATKLASANGERSRGTSNGGRGGPKGAGVLKRGKWTLLASREHSQPPPLSPSGMTCRPVGRWNTHLASTRVTLQVWHSPAARALQLGAAGPAAHRLLLVPLDDVSWRCGCKRPTTHQAIPGSLLPPTPALTMASHRHWLQRRWRSCSFTHQSAAASCNSWCARMHHDTTRQREGELVAGVKRDETPARSHGLALHVRRSARHRAYRLKPKGSSRAPMTACISTSHAPACGPRRRTAISALQPDSLQPWCTVKERRYAATY